MQTPIRRRPVLAAVGTLALAATVTAAPSSAEMSAPVPSGAVTLAVPALVARDAPESIDARFRAATLAAFGLDAGRLVLLPDLPGPGSDFSVALSVNGVDRMIRLAPHGMRSDTHQLLVDLGDGVLAPVDPGPERTVRGLVDGLPGARAAGGVSDRGLTLVVAPVGGERTWIEPAAHRVPGAPAALHVVYRDGDANTEGFFCGNDAFEVDPAALARAAAAAADGATEGGSGDICTTELAADADFEYFQDYGTPQAVQNRIAEVINVMNLQYESQVLITHDLGTVIVRQTSNDPYSSNGSFDLLCEFITEWSNNQVGIQRDTAQLFTGRNVSGGTIGRAADIGGTGICENQGGCSGGQFGTFGSYSFVESDFNGSFGSATDLSAHELGHLWGAFHCSCSNFTMNAFITSANVFSAGSINSITNYRDTRDCIQCGPEIFPGACCLPSGACVVANDEASCAAAGGTFLGENTECSECTSLVGACCLPDGSCLVLDEGICDTVGGVFNGDGTTCADGACGPDCPADFDGSGDVGFDDLVQLLSVFGPCVGCPEDLDDDGTVAFDDLVELLSVYGPCP